MNRYPIITFITGVAVFTAFAVTVLALLQVPA